MAPSTWRRSTSGTRKPTPSSGWVTSSRRKPSASTATGGWAMLASVLSRSPPANAEVDLVDPVGRGGVDHAVVELGRLVRGADGPPLGAARGSG